MKWLTPTGRLKDIPVHRYRVDWMADQGSQFSSDVLDFFEPYWRHDVVYSELPVAGTKMRYDFVNLTKHVILETDGIAHLTPKSHFHGGIPAKWLDQIKRDDLKNQMARRNGFIMVRIEPDHLPLTKKWVEETFDITL